MAVLEPEHRSNLKPHQAAEQPGATELYTSEEFAVFAANYPDLQMEMTREGKIVIMPPSGGESSNQSSIAGGRLFAWNDQHRLGFTFDANGGYNLPGGGTRAPDASWVSRDRWEALTPEQKRKFLPLSPDFAVEVLSPTDSLLETRTKMVEYMASGTRLAWLINPRTKQVEIYRMGQDIEILDAPVSLSGEEVLPGFVLNLEGILF